jgi:phage FluMu protein Com
MSDKFCARCGKSLVEGSLKYLVHIQILSDFDGVLPYAEEDLSEEIHGLLKNAEAMDAQDLEDDVYQEISFVLCEKCKKLFARDPFSSDKAVFPYNKKMENIIH